MTTNPGSNNNQVVIKPLTHVLLPRHNDYCYCSTIDRSATAIATPATPYSISLPGEVQPIS